MSLLSTGFTSMMGLPFRASRCRTLQSSTVDCRNDHVMQTDRIRTVGGSRAEYALLLSGQRQRDAPEAVPRASAVGFGALVQLVRDTLRTSQPVQRELLLRGSVPREPASTVFRLLQQYLPCGLPRRNSNACHPLP
jgi:hypothetical protein